MSTWIHLQSIVIIQFGKVTKPFAVNFLWNFSIQRINLLLMKCVISKCGNLECWNIYSELMPTNVWLVSFVNCWKRLTFCNNCVRQIENWFFFFGFPSRLHNLILFSFSSKVHCLIYLIVFPNGQPANLINERSIINRFSRHISVEQVINDFFLLLLFKFECMFQACAVKEKKNHN